MKRKTGWIITVLLSVCGALASEGLPGKKVTIGPEHFSEIYPAVWFCPEDATFVPLAEKSEEPPDARHRIWIEPSDPEINTPPFEGAGNEKHFIEIGAGEDLYRNTKKGVIGREFKRLNRSNLKIEKPVFIYRDKEDQWIFMILSNDREKQTVTFIWRKLE